MRLLCLIALCWLWHAPARAQAAPRPGEARGPVREQNEMELALAGAPATVAQFEPRVRALAARLSVALTVTRPERIDMRELVAHQAQSGARFASVWLDLGDPERALLCIANRGRDRVLVRVVPTRGGYGELTLESLATIIESSLDALLAGGEIGVDRSQVLDELAAQTGAPVAPLPAPGVVAPPSTPAPAIADATPTPAPVLRAITTAITLGYRGDAVDSSALRHGLALALDWSGFFRPACDLWFGVAGQYFPRYALGSDARGVREHGGGARALLGVQGALPLQLRWQLGVGAGVDLMRVEPAIDPEAALDPAEPFLATLPIATALLGIALRMAPWLELALGAGVDVDLAGHHYDVAAPRMRTPVVSPWRAHPYWFVGVAVPFTRGKAGRG